MANGDGSNNGRYRAGEVAAQLSALNKNIETIINRLDGLSDWQRRVDARLAVGSEKFSQAEKERRDTEAAVEKLAQDVETIAKSDQRANRIAVIWGTAIGTASGIIGAAAISHFF